MNIVGDSCQSKILLMFVHFWLPESYRFCKQAPDDMIRDMSKTQGFIGRRDLLNNLIIEITKKGVSVFVLKNLKSRIFE